MNNSLPKWLVQTLGILLIVFIALLVIDKGYGLQQSFANRKPANTISVSGEGKVTATPDLATVNIGVITTGTTASDVQNQSSTKINKIIDFVKTEGVAKEDISTSQFSIYPQQDYSNGKTTITGYQANQTVEVKVHGVDKGTDKLSAILGGVTDNGANQINGVSLSFNDPGDLQEQARKLAINKAKQQAQDLASAAGLKLGKVVNVSEAGFASPGPIPYAPQAMTSGIAQDKAVAPNIETGSQDITANMTVTFEVK